MIKIFMIILFLSSCSNLSVNMTQEGEFELIGGVLKTDKWKDKLIFKRVSWYQELNMLFDIYIAKMETSSPFYNWFSFEEKNDLARCDSKYIIMTYHLDSNRISRESFENQLESQRFRFVGVSHFNENIKLHPDYARSHFRLYRINALCGKNHSVTINFPGFNEYTIKL